MRNLYLVLAISLLPFAQQARADSNPVETRVYLNNSCVIADEPVVVEDFDASKGFFSGGIVASLAQAMLTTAVKSVAGAIESSASSKDYVYPSEQELYLYKAQFAKSPDALLNEQLACVTLVSGQFEDENADCVSDYEPAMMAMSEVSQESINAMRETRAASNVLRRANICLAGRPHYVFESKMILSDDGAAYRMRSAGFEVNELQSARKEKDTRALVSTYSIVEPSADGRGRMLSNNWIEHGTVKPGDKKTAMTDTTESGWTRLPALSGAAKQSYLKDSARHRAISIEMEKLEHSILRSIREQTALNEQAEMNSDPVAAELRKAATRLDTRIAMNTASLEALRAEFDELPKSEHEYMLVKMRVSMTETRSEQQMKRWVADMIDANSRLISRGVVEAINEND